MKKVRLNTGNLQVKKEVVSFLISMQKGSQNAFADTRPDGSPCGGTVDCGSNHVACSTPTYCFC